MIDSKKIFFPRDLEFWMYHWGCVSLLVGTSLAIVYSRQEVVSPFNLLGTIAWLPLFTIAVLGYRYTYKKRDWSELNTQSLVLISFAFSLLASFLVTLLLFVSLAPIFISNFLLVDQFYIRVVPVSDFVWHILVINTIQSFIFMSAWIFIYVSVTSSRENKAAQIEKLKLENSLKNAKIKSLSNQINPHFLFNTLNNIRFMMYEDIQKADDVITSFSEILRYSLRESEKEKVTLAEEWEVAQRYIEVIELQFDKKVNLISDLDDDQLCCMIPPMALQFLVENAVKHGVVFPESGYLRISISERNRKILIVVENAVSCKENRNTLSKKSSTGTGIKNLEDRLTLLYQERATLEIDRSENHFFVKISLPREEAVT